MLMKVQVCQDRQSSQRSGGAPSGTPKSARCNSCFVRIELGLEDEGEVFLFTDVDVQYFQPVAGPDGACLVGLRPALTEHIRRVMLRSASVR